MDLRRPKVKWNELTQLCRKSPFWIRLCGISMFSQYPCGLSLYYGFLPQFKNLQISSSGNLLVWMVWWVLALQQTSNLSKVYPVFCPMTVGICSGFFLKLLLLVNKAFFLVRKFSFRLLIMNNIVYSGMYLSTHHSHPSCEALPGHNLFRLSIPLWTITGFTLVIGVYAFKLRSSLLKIREKGMRGSYNFLEMKNYSVD